jgi:integrase/recombinase XerC
MVDDLERANRRRARFAGKATASDVWKLLLADKSPDTQAAYEFDLRTFGRFLQLEPGDAAAFLLAHGQAQANRLVHSYQAWMYEQPVYAHGSDPATSSPVRIGYAPATVNRKINALRSLVNMSRLFGLVAWDVEVRMRPVENVRDTKGPTASGYAAILEVLEGALAQVADKHDAVSKQAREVIARDRVIIRLLGDRGARRHEIVQVTWPNGVILQPPKIEFRPKGLRIPVWREVSEEAGQAIQGYLDVRGRKPGYLLLSSSGADGSKPLSLSSINRRVDHWSTLAGCPTTPHGLRHYAITAFCAACPDEHVRMAYSGHKDPRSLRRYDDRDYEADIRRFMARVANPDGSSLS